MNVLEKILEEIDREICKQREICNEVLYTPGYRLYEKTMNVAKEIVKRHMDDEDNDGSFVSFFILFTISTLCYNSVAFLF